MGNRIRKRFQNRLQGILELLLSSTNKSGIGVVGSRCGGFKRAMTFGIIIYAVDTLMKKSAIAGTILPQVLSETYVCRGCR